MSLSEEGLEQSQKATCSLCIVQFAKYTCPRCNVQYCSLHCYKSEKHAECSEKFYRECIMSELQSQTTSSEERARMIEILRRVGEEGVEGRSPGQEEHRDEERSEAEGSLEERLAGVDLESEDPDAVWRRLTRSEQEQFRKSLSSGHLSSLLPVHTPWWRHSKSVVIEEEEEEADTHHIPDILPSLPPLHSLVKEGTASPMIRYSVLNVLYAYAYTVRLYSGDIHDLAMETAQTVLDISRCLSHNASYSMAGEALNDAVTTVQQAKHICSDGEMALSVLEDVSCILCGPEPLSHCTAPYALSDLHRMLTSAETQLHTQRGLKRECKQVRLAAKKVYFLIVWASENVADLQGLARVVDMEHDTSVAIWRTNSAQKSPRYQTSSSPANSKLITELS